MSAFFRMPVTIARELELVQTSKEGGKELGRVAMTGVPHHALDRYSTAAGGKGLCGGNLRPGRRCEGGYRRKAHGTPSRFRSY